MKSFEFEFPRTSQLSFCTVLGENDSANNEFCYRINYILGAAGAELGGWGKGTSRAAAARVSRVERTRAVYVF